MFAVIGLGNPGKRYEETRHNAGFWLVSELARRCDSSPSWKLKGGAEFSRVSIGDQPAILVKPLEFMNLSGEAAVPLLRFFKVSNQNCIVAYDDVDLAPGFIRVRRGGSAGGHRGVQDLIKHLGTEDFLRLRLGVGRPQAANGSVDENSENLEKTQQLQQHSAGIERSLASWVLAEPRPKEKELLDKAVSDAVEAVFVLVEEGLKAAQQQFNRKQ